MVLVVDIRTVLKRCGGSLVGYVRTYIVLPALVYGVAVNPLVEAGIAKAHSRFVVQSIIKQAIGSGEVGQIGEGSNVWAIVDINECDCAVLTALTQIC